MKLSEIHIRDPYVFPWRGRYFMTGTTRDAWGKTADGIDAYSSADLIDWTPEGMILGRQKNSRWTAYQFWAPEMLERDGRVYLFYSGKTDSSCRATGVAVAESPRGPFLDLPDTPLTPCDWECLDGHVFTDRTGQDYLIYVHEWVQAGLGQMWIQPLAPDFTRLTGEKTFLFRGTDAAWSSKVVDGPCMLFHDETYFIFWSSFCATGYCTGYAWSKNIFGPYTQSELPIIAGDGGHASVFTGPQGKSMVSYHTPNRTPFERPALAPLTHVQGRWVAGKPLN